MVSSGIADYYIKALEWSLLLSSNDSAYRRKVSSACGRNSDAVLPQFAIYIGLDY